MGVYIVCCVSAVTLAVSLSKLYQHLEWCARLPLPAVAGISIVSRPSSTPSSYLQGIHPTTATARAYGAAVVQTMSSSGMGDKYDVFATTTYSFV